MDFAAERIDRLLKELKTLIYPEITRTETVEIIKGAAAIGEDPGLDDDGWRPFLPGDRWGGQEEQDRHFRFRAKAVIPPELAGKTVVFHAGIGKAGSWDLANPQFLLFVNGTLVQGLDIRHQEVILCENARAGDEYRLALNAYCGIRGGLSELDLWLSAYDRRVEKLYYDIRVPLDTAGFLDEQDKRRIDMLGLLTQAVNRLDFRCPGSEAFGASVEEALAFMQTRFYGEFCGREEGVTADCVGHTHIDVAWLWTLSQTREKAVRSFSTVLALMREYPEYLFMSSQPQLYQFVKEECPALYEQIREQVRAGRWEPEGGMWVEADCNLSSGESLIRQILFGTRFFEREFGVKNEILWLPDVFGYSAALPQILKKCGIKYFMTTKLGWNEYNQIPCDTFLWRGIDGSEVLTHFITTMDPSFAQTRYSTSYNGLLEPSNIIGAWKRYQQKELSGEVLVSFGYGDGGGGPTREMLENARRMEKGIPGCPRVKMSKAADFFRRLDQTVRDNPKLPRWVGELYLEYHRGTYTSMARNKRFNRKSERLYQEAELFSVMARELAEDAPYPQRELNDGWRTLLLNQFHDIIPGSAIREVYEDSRRDYLRILADGSEILDGALRRIAETVRLPGDAVLVFNPLSYQRTEVAFVSLPRGFENALLCAPDGRPLPQQVCRGGLDGEREAGRVAFLAEAVPPQGFAAFSLKKGAGPVTEGGISADPRILENRFFRVTLDEAAQMVSLFDKRAGREILQPGQKGNVLRAYEDKPHNYDAWDINDYYIEKSWEVDGVERVEVVENGPVFASLRITRRFGASCLVQDIVLYRDIPRIDFHNRVEWNEKQVLLRVDFPVDVAGDKASFDIQFGSVERPTHRNTSWEYARFETCSHKWMDLSEDGYGVSLLNDCKYGGDIHDGRISLTLIKSAADPNETADRETHVFTYSLYPHAEGWRSGGTPAMAYSLNAPLHTRFERAHPGSLAGRFSLLRCDRENVVVETVKRAEDSEAAVIRVYETFGRRSTARLEFGLDVARAFECDMLEQNDTPLQAEPNGFGFVIRPFEIKTFKVEFAAPRA